jgi:hypothetical protein
MIEFMDNDISIKYQNYVKTDIYKFFS